MRLEDRERKVLLIVLIWALHRFGATIERRPVYEEEEFTSHEFHI